MLVRSGVEVRERRGTQSGRACRLPHRTAVPSPERGRRALRNLQPHTHRLRDSQNNGNQKTGDWEDYFAGVA